MQNKTSNPQVNIDDLDLETWLRWVHEGPCCSHPKDPVESNCQQQSQDTNLP